MYRNHEKDFECDGLTFAMFTAPDDTGERPWDNDCGTGIVREARGESCYSRRPLKAPGERFLTWDRGHGWAYDWQGTMKKARADGWGLNDKSMAALVARLGREPRGREVIEESVRLDFERLSRWCRDEWCYVGVIVELRDAEGELTDESESLWGIESDSYEYHDEVAADLASEISSRLGSHKGAGLRKKTITRKSAARVERIRVRA